MAAPKLVRRASLIRPGAGSKRIKSVLAVLYGAPKVRKTTSASYLKGFKWMVTDSNAVPTLRALDRLPPPEDIYELTALTELRQLIQECLDAVEKNGVEALGCAGWVLDSITALNDWHQQDVAQSSGQRFMGDNPKNGGWQQFNAEFGAFIDDLAALSRHLPVVVIAHAKEKADTSKGEWSGLNLSPQMALKMGRTANWVLYQTSRSFVPDKDTKADEYVQVINTASGKRAIEVIIHTQPVGLWIASANAKHLEAEEPANLQLLLEKEGLL